MRRISGLLPKRALAPRPRCGAAAPRASPFLLLPPGPGAVGAGRALSVRVDQPRPWPLPPSGGGVPPSVARCRPLSLPRQAQRWPLDQAGRVRSSAGCGRPARPGRWRLVWRRAPCSLFRAHHADGPDPSTRARPSVSWLRGSGGPVEASCPPATRARETLSRVRLPPARQRLLWQPAPSRACHGSRGQSASTCGSPSGVHCVFFRSDPGARIGKKLLFLRGKGGRTGEHRSKGGSWFCNMAGQHAPET